jgi:hypothetical protein
MSDNKEAGKLILADLAMFDQAVLLFKKEVAPEIHDKFAEAVKEWADRKEWLCNIDWDWSNTEKNSIWVAPKGWSTMGATDNDVTADLCFNFCWPIEVGSQSFPLADLCGVGSTSMGFWFGVDNSNFPGVKKPVWKSVLESLYAEYAERLKPFGVDPGSENDFYRILNLIPSELAAAYEEDDYGKAFAPLLTVLDALEEAWPIFDEMITKARESLKLSTCSV